MNRKISLGLAISLVAIGCAITFVLTWTVSLNSYNAKIASTEKYEGVYQKLREMDATVRGNYIGNIDNDVLSASIINGYVNGIGDQYATYMSADLYYDYQQTNSGVINGAGFEAEADGSGYLKVTKVYPNSSADTSGVKVGDMITEINDRSLLSMTADTALQRISGEVGTKLSIKLVSNGEERSVTLVRQQIDIESVTHRLIPASAAATAEYTNGVRRTLIETDSEESVTLPIVVLTDAETSSAAEVFAVALRDEQGAQLVGKQTAGKAVLQSTYEFSDGSALVLTTANIIPSRSERFDGVGLKPDYNVDLSIDAPYEMLTTENDTQLQKAIEVLTPQANGNNTSSGDNNSSANNSQTAASSDGSSDTSDTSSEENTESTESSTGESGESTETE